MFNLNFLIVLSLTCSSVALGASLIELNDKNQAILNLELSKALKGVQDAVESDFEFTSVSGALKFLDQCRFVQKAMSKADDADYEGLAGQIKAILAEPKIVGVCSISRSALREFFTVLDTGMTVDDLSHLFSSKMSQLEELSRAVKANEHLNTLLGHLVKNKIQQFGEELLNDGARDVTVSCQEKLPQQGLFDLDVHYKSGCDIGVFEQICKLVRGSHQPNAKALGHDIKHFMEMMKTNDEKIKTLEEQSGVSLEQVKADCSLVKDGPKLKAMRQIDNFLKWGFISQEQVDQSFHTNAELYLYYMINQLCLTL